MKKITAILLLTFLLLTSGSFYGFYRKDASAPKAEKSYVQEETVAQNTEAPSISGYQYKHIVLIGVDGAGAFFSEASTSNIDRIFENGAITYQCLTEQPSISAPCWGSLLHGVAPSLHGLNNAIASTEPYPLNSEFPSIFRVIRENDPNATLASFCGWNAINIGIIEEDLGVYKVGGMSDKEISDKACQYLNTDSPTLMFIQFNEVDEEGHLSGYNSPSYLHKISVIDGYIGEIYDTCFQKGILEDTLFIVTSDHGGLYNDHGGDSNEERYVMFAACGKTVEKGTIRDMEIRDTAAIVTHALGLDNPSTWTARVPSGLFEGMIAGDRPIYEKTHSDETHEYESDSDKTDDK